MKTITTMGWAILVGFMLLGCASDRVAPSDSRPMLTGTINYRARIALPPTAELTVRLLDITQKDEPAVVLVEKSLSNPGNPPIAFALAIPFGGLAANRNYVIDARIEVEGRIKFYSMEQYVVTPKNAAGAHELWLELSGE